jgi:hypothetical protein
MVDWCGKSGLALAKPRTTGAFGAVVAGLDVEDASVLAAIVRARIIDDADGVVGLIRPDIRVASFRGFNFASPSK